MDSTVTFLCTVHKKPLVPVADGYFCPECRLTYAEYALHGTSTRLVNFKFLQPDTAMHCTCNRDGVKNCDIVLNDLVRVTEPRSSTDLSGIAEIYFRDKVDFSGKKILDLGCAEGIFGRYFSEKGMCYGLDACCGRLFQNPRDNALSRGYQKIILAEGSNIPVADESFDIVFAGEIIEHIIECRLFLREIRRVLAPGGIIALTTPNLVSLANRLSMLIGDGRGYVLNQLFKRLLGKKVNYFDNYCGIRYPENMLHVRFFTFKSLELLVTQERFRPFRQVGRDPVLAPKGRCRFPRNYCDQIVLCAEKTS